MPNPIKNCPDCVYGNRCVMICVNSNCRKPAFICEQGLATKSECALFHQKCEKLQWSQLQNIICQNPNTKIPQLMILQDQIENVFSTLIKKVKQQHLHFKRWVGYYGFNPHTINFINMVNENNYNSISGVFMNQVLSTLFMNEDKLIETNFSVDQCQQTLKSIQISIDRLRQLYYPDNKKEKMSFSTTVSMGSQILGFDSKVTNQQDYIRSLFPKQSIKAFNLLYRASENGFSVAQFHKKCDNISHTMTILQTQYGKVIGGYTPLPWNSSKKHWAADKTQASFIFSVDTRQKFGLNLTQFAIACNQQKGPIFGCCDICIVDNSNIEKSNSEFPISYNNFKYSRNPQSSQAFTGHMKGRFTTKEWEVFQIQFYE